MGNEVFDEIKNNLVNLKMEECLAVIKKGLDQKAIKEKLEVFFDEVEKHKTKLDGADIDVNGAEEIALKLIK